MTAFQFHAPLPHHGVRDCRHAPLDI